MAGANNSPFWMNQPQYAFFQMPPPEKKEEAPPEPKSSPMNMPMFPPAAALMPQRSSMKSSVSFSAPMGDETRETFEQFQEMIRERQGGLEGMETQLQQLQEQKPDTWQTMDLRPLVGLLDTKDAYALGQLYKPPTDLADHEKKIQGLQDAIVKERGGITDDLARLAQQKTHGRWITEQGRQARFEQNQRLKMEDNIRKAFDKPTEEYQSRMQQFDNIDTAIEKGDIAYVKSLLSQIARNIGGEKGALSDGDVGRSFRSDLLTDIQSIGQYLTGEGTMSPAVQQRIKELVANTKAKATQYHLNRMERVRMMYATPDSAYSHLMTPGRVGSEISNIQTGGLVNDSQQAGVPQQRQQTPQGGPSPDEMRKILGGKGKK